MESSLKKRQLQKKKRMLRVRKHLKGNAEKPRLSVFRSNRHLLAQLIDDEAHKTLFGISSMSKGIEGRKSKEVARTLGAKIAEHAKQNNISRVVFDRGSYKYHGVIAELANSAREGGLQF